MGGRLPREGEHPLLCADGCGDCGPNHNVSTKHPLFQGPPD